MNNAYLNKSQFFAEELNCNLTYYLKALESLNSVGEKRKATYKRLAGERFVDALLHLPNASIKRHFIEDISKANEHGFFTLEVTVYLHYPNIRKGKPYKILVHDSQNTPIELIFFNPYANYLLKSAPEGKKILLSGQIRRNKMSSLANIQMSHPDFMGSTSEIDKWTGFEGIYPLTYGITKSMIAGVINEILSNASQLEEWLDESWNLPSFLDSLKKIHNPEAAIQINDIDEYRKRLILDEYVAYHLAMALSIEKDNQKKINIILDTSLSDALESKLKFSLTDGQKQVIKEIRDDLMHKNQMVRLIQGDVGSGKTIIAVIAACDVIASGKQVALLVPTEILAKQHYEKINEYLSHININAVLLTGRERGKKRDAILKQIINDDVKFIIGTHALIEEDVSFNNLGLVIIDEQHRFGVDQRLSLSKKANNPHILSMTATPIPRTLVLANHGDMSISNLFEKPVGRKDIITKVIHRDKLDEVIAQICKISDQGRQIYWVCPLIEESEKLDIAAATDRFAYLQKIFGDKVKIIHGKMKNQEKDQAMSDFSEGKVKVLVSTTVIEVGVDVPNATVMIIENAQRFGLAQLHQLRGRVGRSNLQSFCILIYNSPLTFQGKKRLEILRESCDGFEIARQDLRLRGGGEIIGTRQSGIPKFRLSSMSDDNPKKVEQFEEFFETAHKYVYDFLAKDPNLETPKGIRLKNLLNIFKRDNIDSIRKSG